MKKSKIVLAHTLLWIVFIIAFSLFSSELFSRMNNKNASFLFICIESIIFTIGISIPFYYGYIITPHFLRSQRKSIYVAISFLIWTLPSAYWGVCEGQSRESGLYAFGFMLIFLILGVGFRSIFGWIEQKQIQEELEKQNIKSELNLLRVQLNPHFLFNTLHNIDALIYEDKEKASKTIEKLSDIMRYMLKETKVDFVDLHKELEYFENYISLEKIRLKNEKFLSCNVVNTTKNIKIAPMILISFIENAFKHSVDSEIDNGINIDLKIDNNILDLVCINKYNQAEVEQDKVGGIGLETVKKRLELIYPGKHKLSIKTENSTFTVNLEIILNEN